MIMYKTLLTTLEDGIFTVTINRPDKLNAINKEVMADLDHVFSEVEDNEAINASLQSG